MNEESIFAAVLEKKTAGERQALLNQACAGNAELRVAVEGLLQAESAAGSFLEHPPAAMDATVISERSSRDTVNMDGGPVSLEFLQPCDKPERIGKLGVYEVIEVVGQGGMGVVLRAFDTKLCRVVALKVMSPGLACNPSAVKRFLREATAAAAVHHDHVVTIHAVDDTHQPPYLVMQFIEGETLEQKIDSRGALELTHILRIGSQAAAGLAAAHKMGLVHRDVKPANILLENGVERVKITDFGLARAADDLHITQQGLIAGTPQYMSPEQAKGELIDTRSDLFSLGSVLYTMCTGRPAFRADSTVAILRRVCDDTPRPIHEVNPEMPLWLEAIINKLLAKNPADRFQTAAEVAELLSQYLAHVQNPAQVPLPASIGERSATASRPANFTNAPAKPKAYRAAIPPAAILTAAALAFLCITLAFTEASGVTHLAATVLRITTGEGMLIIEADDPDIKVAIDGEEVTIHGAGVEEVRLRPGSYKIAATKDGQPVAVDQELVTITRGGKQVVRVALDRTALRSADPLAAAWQPPKDPDPTQILKEAQADATARYYEVALAKHVWYHEHALEYQQSQTGVRVSFALSAWKKLADDYPPALAKLKSIRDEALANVKAGKKGWNSFFDLAALNRTLGEETLTRDTFVWLHANNRKEARMAFFVAQPALIKAKEYKLCGEYLDPGQSFDNLVNMFHLNKRMAGKQKSGEQLLRHGEKSFTNGIATLVAILVVNDRKADAEKVAADAKKEWDNATFHAEIDKALQGNVPEPWPAN